MSNAKIRYRRRRRLHNSIAYCTDDWKNARQECRAFENKTANKYGFRDAPIHVVQKHMALLDRLKRCKKRMQLMMIKRDYL